MREFSESSAYPHVDDFKVMRPEYSEMEDGLFQATITIPPFKVTGRSATKAGARRAAIYESAKTYNSYHPSYKIKEPYPEEFVDQSGMKWERIAPNQRVKLGDYRFIDDEGEEDYADIETMLIWDVRPVSTDE